MALLMVMALFGVGTCSAFADDDQRGQTAAGTDASGWSLALTGGFVISGPVDPVYALGNMTGQASRVVLRQPNQGSSAQLGVAMFGQVYHDRYAWAAPLSVGIGLRDDARETIDLGSALRSGPHASITAGVAFGPVATWPTGVVEGRPVTDTNFLADLATRTTCSWFTGVTYAFATVR